MSARIEKEKTKKEEYVTELSKKTLGSYVKKASSDAADRSFDHGASEKRQYEQMLMMKKKPANSLIDKRVSNVL